MKPQKVILGLFDVIQHTIENNHPNLKYDRREDGWKLVEHIALSLKSFADLELSPILKEREHYVRGVEILERAEDLGPRLGQEDAEWILERKEEIPESLKPFEILFTGTVWLELRGGTLTVPSLWFGREKYGLPDEWQLSFAGLHRPHHNSGLLVQPHKQRKEVIKNGGE
ncbi:MAG: hypothetical protein Q8P07_05155 [bacterium]|nr:hypothetical protein [bacterium]